MTAPDLQDLVGTFSRDHLARNGVPDATETADRERARCALLDALGPVLVPDGLRGSPLGAGWTDVFTAHLRAAAGPPELAALGWLRLDGLRPGDPRWAVVAGDRVLAAVRIAGPAVPDPVVEVLQRCRDRGEVRLREALELRALRRAGHRLPAADPVLVAAAEIESGLGGRELAPWASGRTSTAPAPVRGRRRRPTVVAVGGVDGSGKSTLHAALGRDLRRAGLDVATVWVRPGMGLGPLVALAARAKRLLGQPPEPGLRAVSRADGARPASRRGAVGWLWAALVCISFLNGVWRQHRSAAAADVILYDRHLVDALATLDFAYAGVDLRLHRRLVRALLPAASVRIHLDVPAEVSVLRKPDDLIGAAAVRSQLDAYDRWLVRYPPTLRLDATRGPAELAAESLRAVARHRPGAAARSGS